MTPRICHSFLQPQTSIILRLCSQAMRLSNTVYLVPSTATLSIPINNSTLISAYQPINAVKSWQNSNIHCSKTRESSQCLYKYDDGEHSELNGVSEATQLLCQYNFFLVLKKSHPTFSNCEIFSSRGIVFRQRGPVGLIQRKLHESGPTLRQ